MKEVGYQDDRTVEDELEKSEERERRERKRDGWWAVWGPRNLSSLTTPRYETDFPPMIPYISQPPL